MKWLRALQQAFRPASDSSSAYTEKRDTWRVFHEVRLEGVRASGERVELISTNFGPGGMGVESTKPVKKNDTLKLVLELPGVQAEASARAVWVNRTSSGGAYEVGLKFASGSREFVQTLLDDCRLSIQNPKERRRLPRVRVDSMGAEVGLPTGQVIRARVQDLSVGGALLLSTVNLEKGTRFTVRVNLGEQVEALIFQARVVRIGPPGELRTIPLSVQFLEISDSQRNVLASYVGRLLQSD